MVGTCHTLDKFEISYKSEMSKFAIHNRNSYDRELMIMTDLDLGTLYLRYKL